MSGDFFRTQMGHMFYEATMPRLVEALQRIAEGVSPVMDQKQAREQEEKEFWKASFLAALHSMSSDAMEPVKAAMGRADEALLTVRAKWDPQPAPAPAERLVNVERRLEEAQDLCESCLVSVVPGVVFPIASNEMTDHAYVEVCDTCPLFQDDVCAAVAVGRALERRVKASEDGRPYIEGLSFEEAQTITRDLAAIKKAVVS